MDHFFHRLLYLFITCVGIGSVQMGEPSIRNKGETISNMPRMATSGKLAHAGKRKHAHQLLKSEQRQRNCRNLLYGNGGGSGGVNYCNPERRTVQQQKLARRRDGNGGGSRGIDNCNPKWRTTRQQNLASWRDGDSGGSGSVNHCDPKWRTARQQNLARRPIINQSLSPPSCLCRPRRQSCCHHSLVCDSHPSLQYLVCCCCRHFLSAADTLIISRYFVDC